MARRTTQLSAVAALLAALVGGSYAAHELLQGSAATPTSTISCPRNAPEWRGAVYGPRPPSTHPVQEARTVALINAFRRAHGLPALLVDAHLSEAARAHDLNMLRFQFFDHDAPAESFTQRLARYSPASCLAENIAWGTGSFGTGPGTVTAWKNSPGHRRNMLLPWIRRVGVGVESGSFLGAGGARLTTADFSG